MYIFRQSQNFLSIGILCRMKFNWCKNPETNKYLPFDFYIPDLNLIIEIDGDQHFEQVSTT